MFLLNTLDGVAAAAADTDHFDDTGIETIRVETDYGVSQALLDEAKRILRKTHESNL